MVSTRYSCSCRHEALIPHWVGGTRGGKEVTIEEDVAGQRAKVGLFPYVLVHKLRFCEEWTPKQG